MKEQLQEKEGIDVSQMFVFRLVVPSPQATHTCELTPSFSALPPLSLSLPLTRRILYGGTQCEDTATLEQKKVKAGDTLHMVLSLRG